MSLSDKDYQKKLDVQIAYWDKLKNEIQKVRSGENGTADLVDMSETYFQMADETVAAVKVSHANRQLEQKAYIDLHTGLPNKSKCEELFHNVEFIKTPTACIVFDMNNLKRVNDSLGHSIGDQLILNFARLLRNSIPAKHFVGRYGGDEFMAVIYDATRESITEILTEFQNEVEQFNGYGTQFRISYSHQAGTPELKKRRNRKYLIAGSGVFSCCFSFIFLQTLLSAHIPLKNQWVPPAASF